MLTTEQIATAKRTMKYSHDDPLHEHDDCIRIAYIWLDAQVTIATPMRRSLALKHIIEAWGCRYVSQSDVELAAAMHPTIFGAYPRFNISSRLIYPSRRRLIGVGEAGKHLNYNERYNNLLYPAYARREWDDGRIEPWKKTPPAGQGFLLERSV